MTLATPEPTMVFVPDVVQVEVSTDEPGAVFEARWARCIAVMDDELSFEAEDESPDYWVLEYHEKAWICRMWDDDMDEEDAVEGKGAKPSEAMAAARALWQTEPL